MRYIIIIAILVLSLTVFSNTDETNPEDFLRCVRKNMINIGPSQSTFGDFTFIDGADTISGRYFLLPPRGTFITLDDTVDFLPMTQYDDPWFHILTNRHPVHDDHYYNIKFAEDSAAFVLFDYLSRDYKEPNIRVAYDRNICEMYSMTLFWPDTAGHAFPGADVIKYEVYIADNMTITPKRRDYLNRKGSIVESFIYETIETPGITPPDSIIIGFLLDENTLQGEDK